MPPEDDMTQQEYQEMFETILQNAIATGAYCPDDCGLEWEVSQAIDACARATPNVPQGLIDEARHSMVNQLQGL